MVRELRRHRIGRRRWTGTPTCKRICIFNFADAKSGGRRCERHFGPAFRGARPRTARSANPRAQCGATTLHSAARTGAASMSRLTPAATGRRLAQPTAHVSRNAGPRFLSSHDEVTRVPGLQRIISLRFACAALPLAIAVAIARPGHASTSASRTRCSAKRCTADAGPRFLWSLAALKGINWRSGRATGCRGGRRGRASRA
jgi:hypothetical protein